MKIARWLLCIIAFSAVILGCGEDPNELVITSGYDMPDFHEQDPYSWRIVSINGEALKKPFDNHRSNYRREGTLVHRIVFSDTGWFIYKFEFRAGEGDAEAWKREHVFYTTCGSYMTQGNMLTMSEASTAWDVEVHLGPEVVWQEQIEGMTLEEHTSNLVAELLKESQQEMLPVFIGNREYTWQIEGDLLTLSSPQQTIALARPSLGGGQTD